MTVKNDLAGHKHIGQQKASILNRMLHGAIYET